MTAPPPPNGALSAFLRGVERRGVVFAELQAGDAARGDAAIAATLRGFSAVAPRAPFVEWPRRFWSMLLAAPSLRGASAAPVRDGPLAVLAGLGSGPRAALLLRLVAGLSEGDAAATLGIARPTYRLALQRALPRTDAGTLDTELWRAMGDAAQQALRDLPAARLERVAALRDGRPEPAPAHPPRATPMHARWLWPVLAGVALLTALALAATWWGPFATGASADGLPRIDTRPLPAQGTPPMRYGEEVALLTHRDLDLLLADDAAGAPPAEPAFDAWLAVALDTPAEENDAPSP